MSVSIHIDDADNGYCMEVYGLGPSRKFVYTNEEGEHGELDALQAMFYQILEEMGQRGSKHDKRRMYITIEDNKEEVI